MNAIDAISAVLTLLAGIGIFLIACKTMSSNLESAGSNHLKSLFSKISGSRLLGVGIGTAGTALIQSSGATTVMVIGFVNAGVMTLGQAATVIYGANIGTTVTGQIVALGLTSSSSLSTTLIFSSLAGVGAFISLFSKKKSAQRLGGILAGFGMLFIGLSTMGGSMEVFAESETIRSFLASVKNSLLLILIGTVLTAVVQSSSVMTSVAITMLVAGLITLDQGIYITMGSNIGACVVSLIAGYTGGRKAKQASLLSLYFNLGGTVVFLLLEWLLGLFGFSYGRIFLTLFPSLPQTQLAMFHTFYNLAKTLLFLPFTGLLVKLVEKSVSKKDGADESLPHFYFVDDHLLRTPAVAVNQVKKEIVNMAKIAMDNFSLSCEIACTQEDARLEEFRRAERQLDFLNRELVKFVVKVSDNRISPEDHVYLASTFRTVADLERVGDYAENIIEYSDELKAGGERFSKDAVAEIQAVRDLIFEVYTHALAAYENRNFEEVEQAKFFEEMVDDVTKEMEENHITRLNAGECTPNAGAQYLSLASDAERIADHFMNVANAVKNFA